MSILAPGQTVDLAALAAWWPQTAAPDAYGPRAVQDDRGIISLSTFLGDTSEAPKSRAQLVGPFVIEQGSTYRLDGAFRVAATALPKTLPSGTWAELVQVAYGPPFAGSPPLRWMVTGDTLVFRHADDWPALWSEPLPRETWVRFSLTWLHAISGGWVTLTVAHDDAAPTIVLNQQPCATVLSSNNSPTNATYLDCYQSGLQQAGPFQFRDFAITRVS